MSAMSSAQFLAGQAVDCVCMAAAAGSHLWHRSGKVQKLFLDRRNWISALEANATARESEKSAPREDRE